jgi:hypothetical protein
MPLLVLIDKDEVLPPGSHVNKLAMNLFPLGSQGQRQE